METQTSGSWSNLAKYQQLLASAKEEVRMLKNAKESQGTMEHNYQSSKETRDDQQIGAKDSQWKHICFAQLTKAIKHNVRYQQVFSCTN